MKTPATKTEKAYAVAFHALAKHAGRKSDRDAIEEGALYEVKLLVVGTVDGQYVHEHIQGQLVVGMDNPTGSTKSPNATHLLCAAMAVMPKTRRERLIAMLQEDGVPVPEDGAIKQLVSGLIKRLSTTSNKRGAVSFQPEQEK